MITRREFLKLSAATGGALALTSKFGSFMAHAAAGTPNIAKFINRIVHPIPKLTADTTTYAGAACHAPEVGFTGPDALVNAGGPVYPGALPNHFGNRKPPASAYAGDSPRPFTLEICG